jgi:hypothetical protein
LRGSVEVGRRVSGSGSVIYINDEDLRVEGVSGGGSAGQRQWVGGSITMVR